MLQFDEPMYGMSDDQERKFFYLSDRLRSLGYWVSSEPLQGQIDGWLEGIERNIARIEDRLADCQKAYRVRGRSKAARYFLTSNDRFDPGFGMGIIYLTPDYSSGSYLLMQRAIPPQPRGGCYAR